MHIFEYIVYYKQSTDILQNCHQWTLKRNQQKSKKVIEYLKNRSLGISYDIENGSFGNVTQLEKNIDK